MPLIPNLNQPFDFANSGASTYTTPSTFTPGATGQYSVSPGTVMNSSTGAPVVANQSGQSAQPQSAVGPSAAPWTPSFRTDIGGYNPAQYATLDTSNQLAQALGGNVLQTRIPSGPYNVPPSNMIDFGGDSPLNAGLLAQRYAMYPRELADRMTQDELRMQGPRSWNPDEAFGAGSQFTPVAGGGLFGGQGANLGQSIGENAGWRQNLSIGNPNTQNPLAVSSGPGDMLYRGERPNYWQPGNGAVPSNLRPTVIEQFDTPNYFSGGFGPAMGFYAANNPFFRGSMSGFGNFQNRMVRRPSLPSGGYYQSARGFNPYNYSPNFSSGRSNYASRYF